MKDKTFKIMALLVVFLCCGVAVINATTDTAVITVTSHVAPVDVSTTSTVPNILGMFYLSDGTDTKLTNGAVDS